MKQRVKKVLGWLTAIFVVLFLFRLGYGYTKKINDYNTSSSFFDIGSGGSFRKNYASKEYKVKGKSASPVQVDQKYEKIAEVNTKSSAFEEEEKLVRQQIKDNNALIQFEQKKGNKGARQLHLLIGVPPENFDGLYASLIQIGTVQSKQITKKDKTNEYKELNAKKASLEKIRASLLDLKSKGGKIEEFINLENRILDIEQQLQDLGVNLGDFDDENEFCTVKLSLNEGKKVEISFMHRLKVAFEWTIRQYFWLMFIGSFMVFFAYVFLLALDKLRAMGQQIIDEE